MHSPRKVLSCAEFRSEFYANESKRRLESRPDPAKALINSPAAETAATSMPAGTTHP
jgi:hypothetical protein